MLQISGGERHRASFIAATKANREWCGDSAIDRLLNIYNTDPANDISTVVEEVNELRVYEDRSYNCPLFLRYQDDILVPGSSRIRRIVDPDKCRFFYNYSSWGGPSPTLEDIWSSYTVLTPPYRVCMRGWFDLNEPNSQVAWRYLNKKEKAALLYALIMESQRLYNKNKAEITAAWKAVAMSSSPVVIVK